MHYVVFIICWCLSVDGRLHSVCPVHGDVVPLGLESLQDGVVLRQAGHALQHDGLPCKVTRHYSSLPLRIEPPTLDKRDRFGVRLVESVVMI